MRLFKRSASRLRASCARGESSAEVAKKQPGRKLLDECCHHDATGQLKYLSPDRCISRLREVTHGKPATRQVELDHTKLVIREHEELTQPAGSALQVQESLRRRGLAYTFAQAVSWQAYDTYLTKLFKPDRRGGPTSVREAHRGQH